jgi:hypothetical protein
MGERFQACMQYGIFVQMAGHRMMLKCVYTCRRRRDGVYVSVVDSLFAAISLNIYVGLEVSSDLVAWGYHSDFWDLAISDRGAILRMWGRVTLAWHGKRPGVVPR